MTMNDELIQLFKEVACAKKAFPYNFAQLILDSFPRVKPLWKDFSSGARKFQMDKLILKHGTQFQMTELHFIEFLKTCPFVAKEIFEIMYIQKHIDDNGMAEKYKYTEEELAFMLNKKQEREIDNQAYQKAEETYFKEKVTSRYINYSNRNDSIGSSKDAL